MADRFPDYDVLTKRDTPSWNAATCEVIDARLRLGEATGLLTAAQIATLRALAERIVPQPEHRPPVNTVALLLASLTDATAGEGYRPAGLPPAREAWTRGLDAIEAEARLVHGRGFAALAPKAADALLAAIEHGTVRACEWQQLPPRLFWSWRLLPDLVAAYYAHPSAWSAMGFGGPASPRGYVRLAADRRDPWEAAERDDGRLLPAAFRNRHAR